MHEQRQGEQDEHWGQVLQCYSSVEGKDLRHLLTQVQNGDPALFHSQVLHTEPGQLQVALQVQLEQSNLHHTEKEEAPVSNCLVVDVSPEKVDDVQLREHVACEGLYPQPQAEEGHEVAEPHKGLDQQAAGGAHHVEVHLGVAEAGEDEDGTEQTNQEGHPQFEGPEGNQLEALLVSNVGVQQLAQAEGEVPVALLQTKVQDAVIHQQDGEGKHKEQHSKHDDDGSFPRQLLAEVDGGEGAEQADSEQQQSHQPDDAQVVFRAGRPGPQEVVAAGGGVHGQRRCADVHQPPKLVVVVEQLQVLVQNCRAAQLDGCRLLHSEAGVQLVVLLAFRARVSVPLPTPPVGRGEADEWPQSRVRRRQVPPHPSCGQPAAQGEVGRQLVQEAGDNHGNDDLHSQNSHLRQPFPCLCSGLKGNPIDN